MFKRLNKDIFKNPTKTQWNIPFLTNNDFHYRTTAYHFMIPKMVISPLNKEKEVNYVLDTVSKMDTIKTSS